MSTYELMARLALEHMEELNAPQRVMLLRTAKEFLPKHLAEKAEETASFIEIAEQAQLTLKEMVS
jgi:hypothetical protein